MHINRAAIDITTGSYKITELLSDAKKASPANAHLLYKLRLKRVSKQRNVVCQSSGVLAGADVC